MRLYLTSDSFPEIRELTERRARWRLMARAAMSSIRDVRMIALFIGMALAHVPALVVLFLHSMRTVGQTTSLILATVVVLGWLLLSGAVFVALIGDLLRVHARATSLHARYACPNCGYGLRGLMEDADATASVRCPECAESVEVALCAPPYALPRRYTSWGRWSPSLR